MFTLRVSGSGKALSFYIPQTSPKNDVASAQILASGKNDFAEGSKILLDTDLKIILSDHQYNLVGILKIMSNAANKLV